MLILLFVRSSIVLYLIYLIVFTYLIISLGVVLLTDFSLKVLIVFLIIVGIEFKLLGPLFTYFRKLKIYKMLQKEQLSFRERQYFYLNIGSIHNPHSIISKIDKTHLEKLLLIDTNIEEELLLIFKSNYISLENKKNLIKKQENVNLLYSICTSGYSVGLQKQSFRKLKALGRNDIILKIFYHPYVFDNWNTKFKAFLVSYIQLSPEKCKQMMINEKSISVRKRIVKKIIDRDFLEAILENKIKIDTTGSHINELHHHIKLQLDKLPE